jgi:hypothetical protein
MKTFVIPIVLPVAVVTRACCILLAGTVYSFLGLLPKPASSQLIAPEVMVLQREIPMPQKLGLGLKTPEEKEFDLLKKWTAPRWETTKIPSAFEALQITPDTGTSDKTVEHLQITTPAMLFQRPRTPTLTSAEKLAGSRSGLAKALRGTDNQSKLLLSNTLGNCPLSFLTFNIHHYRLTYERRYLNMLVDDRSPLRQDVCECRLLPGDYAVCARKSILADASVVGSAVNHDMSGGIQVFVTDTGEFENLYAYVLDNVPPPNANGDDHGNGEPPIKPPPQPARANHANTVDSTSGLTPTVDALD